MIGDVRLRLCVRAVRAAEPVGVARQEILHGGAAPTGAERKSSLRLVGGVLVLLLEGREAAELEGVRAALRREVVGDRVVAILNVEQLTGWNP